MKLYFKNFINLSEEEKVILLKLRNADYIRKNMYNTEIISLSSHFAWINNLKNREDCIYWAILKDDKIIGCIDLTGIDFNKKIAEWGFYIDEKCTGLGAIIEYLGMRHFFNDMCFQCVMCRVLSDNKQVYNMHKNKFGFVAAPDFSIISSNRNFNGLMLTSSVWSKVEKKINCLLNRIFKLSEVVWE